MITIDTIFRMYRHLLKYGFVPNTIVLHKEPMTDKKKKNPAVVEVEFHKDKCECDVCAGENKVIYTFLKPAEAAEPNRNVGVLFRSHVTGQVVLSHDGDLYTLLRPESIYNAPYSPGVPITSGYNYNKYTAVAMKIEGEAADLIAQGGMSNLNVRDANTWGSLRREDPATWPTGVFPLGTSLLPSVGMGTTPPLTTGSASNTIILSSVTGLPDQAVVEADNVDPLYIRFKREVLVILFVLVILALGTSLLFSLY